MVPVLLAARPDRTHLVSLVGGVDGYDSEVLTDVPARIMPARSFGSHSGIS